MLITMVRVGVSHSLLLQHIVLVTVLRKLYSDLMRNLHMDLLNAPQASPMTSTHMNYMMNPELSWFWIRFLKNFPGQLINDFEMMQLNKKIGFWGSKNSSSVSSLVSLGIMGTLHIQEQKLQMQKWRLVIKEESCLLVCDGVYL